MSCSLQFKSAPAVISFWLVQILKLQSSSFPLTTQGGCDCVRGSVWVNQRFSERCLSGCTLSGTEIAVTAYISSPSLTGSGTWCPPPQLREQHWGDKEQNAKHLQPLCGLTKKRYCANDIVVQTRPSSFAAECNLTLFRVWLQLSMWQSINSDFVPKARSGQWQRGEQ